MTDKHHEEEKGRTSGSLSNLEAEPGFVPYAMSQPFFIKAMLPSVEREHVTTMTVPLRGVDRFEIYAITGKPDAWRPGFHTHVSENLVPTGYALLNTASLPDDMDALPYNDVRATTVRKWYARLHAACYAEIFRMFPRLYDRLMQSVYNELKLIGPYPPLHSDEYMRLIQSGVLGNIQVDGLIEDGYITVPKEWMLNG